MKKHRNNFCQRAAFTLVEVLTVVGVIGLVVGLLLPAVQSAREQARKTLCANRLRQIGVAYQNFESAHGRFPPSVARTPTATPPQAMMSDFYPKSAHYYLLPFLELAGLYEQIAFESDVWSGSDPVKSSRNQALIEHPVPAFVCPSDPGAIAPGAVSYLISHGTSCLGYTTPDYSAPNTVQRGVAAGVRTADIVDGMSSTVAFSERLIGDHDRTKYTPSRDLAYVPVLRRVSLPDILPDGIRQICSTQVQSHQAHGSFVSTGWLFGYFATTSYNHVLPPNSAIPDCASASGGVGAYSARSLHPGGVFVLFADGAVDFISETIDQMIWRAVGSIEGQEVGT